MSDDEIDWSAEDQAGAQLVGAFGTCLARLIALRATEGSFEEFVEGFRDGRYSLVLTNAGLTVVKATDAPPAGSPN